MISICILNWNCKEIIEESISLILSDLSDILDYEIIVYDQNSTDGSIEYLKTINNQNNIKVIFGKENCGNSISRNKMIEEARYKYILLLDCDIIPIKNSIKCMIDFMEKNPSYAFLGYECTSFSINRDAVTDYEHCISSNDIVDWKDKFVFSQYGIFKKSILDTFKFPEFYPFDRPGWGAEDDILGTVIYNSRRGKGGCIKNRVYYHQKSSSRNYLGQDRFNQTHMERVIYYFYFTNFLDFQQQRQALIKKSLPSIHLKCNKYIWDIQNNLGDIATDFLLQKYFPFFIFDSTEKTNLLMFGGSIFDHIDSANKKYEANFKEILFFGVGLHSTNSLQNGMRMIKNKNISLHIVPRGEKSRQEFCKHGLICRSPVGDVLQLFAAEDRAEHIDTKPELFIQDIWCPNLIEPRSANNMVIKVAENGTFPEIPFYNLTEYIQLINNVSSVYSSQIHPPFIAALLGKPTYTHQKDWRVDDLKWFSCYKPNMSVEDASKLRLQAQKNIFYFIQTFYEYLKQFA